MGQSITDERKGVFEANIDLTSATYSYIARMSRCHMHSRVKPMPRDANTSLPTTLSAANAL